MKKNRDISELFSLIQILRSPEGCPWDRKQTPETMAKYLVEEAMEAYEAVHSKSSFQAMDELGDTLFQLLFIIDLYEENKSFSFSELIDNTLKKIISRHPHVFGEKKAEDLDEVEKIWADAKKAEKEGDIFESIMDKIPSGLPALMYALKMSKKAVVIGFEWDNLDEVFDKLYEEMEELRRSLKYENKTAQEMEFGDLLFTLVNVGRFMGIESEASLLKSCKKFRQRFQWMEKTALSQGKKLESFERKNMEDLWNRSKKYY